MFVEDYESAQYYDALPRYGSDFYDFLYGNQININKNSVIADVGCGTGRIMIDLLMRGSTVYGIDPDYNMRQICLEKCKQYLDHLNIIDGQDSNMNIPDKSVDYVIVSQSFHRFNLKAFKEECQRVLRCRSNIIIFWYRIDYANPILKEMLFSAKQNYMDYKSRYICPETIGAQTEAQENNESAQKFFDNNSTMYEINSHFGLNKEDFIPLGLSMALLPIAHEMNTISKVLNSSRFNKEAYIDDLNRIFTHYSIDGIMNLDYQIQVHTPIKSRRRSV